MAYIESAITYNPGLTFYTAASLDRLAVLHYQKYS